MIRVSKITGAVHSDTTNEPVMRKQCTCGKPRWALRARR